MSASSGSKPLAKTRAKVLDAIETAATLNGSSQQQQQQPGRQRAAAGTTATVPAPKPAPSAASTSTVDKAATSSASATTHAQSHTQIQSQATATATTAAAAPTNDDYEASKVCAKTSKTLKEEERSMVADLDKWDNGVFSFSVDANLDDSF